MELEKSSAKIIDTLKKQKIEIEAIHQNLVQATIPSSQIESIANLSFVDGIRSPIKPEADIISEATRVIGSNIINNHENNRGQGIKVAVIDVGFDITNQEISSNIQEAISFTSDGNIEGSSAADTNHGTAVSEIIVDVAPDVKLYLYNIDSDVQFLRAVDDIINRVKPDVVSMSLSWLNVGPYDGSSEISQAVNKVRNSGILWVNSAGNYAYNQHWEGQFNDQDRNQINNFEGNDETINMFAIKGQTVKIFLNWDENWNSAVQDYDLYVLDSSTMQIVDYSQDYQLGDGYHPSETVMFVAPYTGIYHVLILKYSTTRPVTFDMFTVPGISEYAVSSSSIPVPGDAEGSFTVGARNWSSDQLEFYSSQGPTNDGRTKPDITGPDGVTTSTINGFYGTSASAPYVAGSAALVKAANPTLDANQIQLLLEQGTAFNHIKNNKDGTGRVDVNFLSKAHGTKIILDPISSIPWGHKFTLKGVLADTANEYNIELNGLPITFTGNGASGINSVTTFANGTFIATGTAQNVVKKGWQVQAHFPGNTKYLASDSTIQHFDTKRHSISLTIAATKSTVPWGQPTAFTALLKDMSNGGIPIEDKAISFSGSGIIANDTEIITNSNGMSVINGKAPDYVNIGFTYQAHFAGDLLYNKKDSSIKKFDTIKHSTSLILTLYPKTTTKNGTFKAYGILNDFTLSTTVKSKTITFTADSTITIPEKTTDIQGKYSVIGLKVPHNAGNYFIQAHFAGDDRYKSKDSTAKILSIS